MIRPLLGSSALLAHSPVNGGGDIVEIVEEEITPKLVQILF
jgi:hypothetical protein